MEVSTFKILLLVWVFSLIILQNDYLIFAVKKHVHGTPWPPGTGVTVTVAIGNMPLPTFS